MTDSSSFTVLVGVDLTDPPSLSASLLRHLTAFDVLLLGWIEVPFQTSTEQAKLEFEEEAQEVLSNLVRPFDVVGTPVKARLVYTHDRFETIERASVEEECDGILIPRSSPEISCLLSPLRGTHIGLHKPPRALLGRREAL